MTRRYALIVAGGKGLRMGSDLPKQFIPLQGKPVLQHTLEAFHRWDAEAKIVLVLPHDHQAYWRMLCEEIPCRVPHAVVDGGDARFDSVKNGLAWISADCPSAERAEALVGVHDGVRPFASVTLIGRCFEAAAETGAVVPCVPMIDSLREVLPSGGSQPVDRSRFLAVQTPQVFALDSLLRAYDQPYSPLFTDDASVMEAAGHAIATVEGERTNIKLTTPLDLRIAAMLLEE